MRIVELGKYFPPNCYGGIELMTELSAEALSAHHEVTVICHNNSRVSEEQTQNGFKVVRCGTDFALFSQPISFSMGRALKDAKPDLIHFHAPNFWAAIMLTVYCPDVPVIVTHHADVEGRAAFKKLLLPIYRHIVRRSRIVFVTSKKNVHRSKDLPKVLNNIVELPCGLDENDYELDAAGVHEAATEKKRLFGNSVVVGFVGRLAWYKGLSVLLKSAVGVPNVGVLIIGEGPLRRQLEGEARELGLSDRVVFVGRIASSEKSKYYHMMDISVLPSTHITEAFGIAQIEAQLCSRPVIRTDLPTGVSDITIDGLTGLVVPAGDAGALSAAIQRLADSESLRTELGQRGRQRALSLFSRSRFADKFNEAVNVALDQRESGAMQLEWPLGVELYK